MIDQIIIGFAGLSTVYLSQDRDPKRQRWACIIGLFAQPAWAWSAWHAGQWAIFLLTFIYSAGWARGVWNFWIRPGVR